MAKNFERAASAKKFTEIARASSERANFVTVKMLRNERLFDYQDNLEDTGDTADLENSIRELGFTDPIEVTSFGMSEGDYMIVSGHRRRAAGVKAGMEVFPCIVKTFDSEYVIKNYVLLSNSQRDSSKDPLLYCRRYKMHEEYLKSTGFKGSVREEIAKRLGISPQQADRYNQFNRIISPVWDMVRDELVGMSSVLSMAVHSVREQEEIFKLLCECADSGAALTREVCEGIIRDYRGRAEDESAVKETGGAGEIKRRKGYGRIVNKRLEALTSCLGGACAFENGQEAEDTLKSFLPALGSIIDRMYAIGESYGKTAVFQELIEGLDEKVDRYRRK